MSAKLHTTIQAVPSAVALFWIAHYKRKRRSVTSRSQKGKLMLVHHKGHIVKTLKCGFHCLVSSSK